MKKEPKKTKPLRQIPAEAMPRLENKDAHTLRLGLSADESARSPSTPMSSEKKPKHTLVSLLGKGGMGNVYMAEDNSLKRRVAYKSLHAHIAKRPDLVQRFVREVQITAQLDHPGVVPVYTMLVGESDTPAYTMKVIEGSTFAELLESIRKHYDTEEKAKAPLPDKYTLLTRLEHFLKVCDTISYAHNKGILHRDLKPENIMLGKFGEVYVVDWGVACQVKYDKDSDSEGPTTKQDNAFLTEAGQLVGTPRYMSPEQARAEVDQLDERSDVYALGLILFELLSLRFALSSGSRSEIIESASKGKLQELQHLSSDEQIGTELQAIVNKATEVLPEQRYPSVATMADDVRRFLRGESISVVPDSKSRALFRIMRKQQDRFALLVALLVLLIVGLSGWWLYQQKQNEMMAEKKQQTLARQLLVASRQSFEVEQRFFRWEGLLERLASTTQLALTHVATSATPYYLHHQFHPPDLKWSELYRDKLSLRWPVSKLPLGGKEETFRPQLYRLSWLQTTLRRILFDSIPSHPRRTTAAFEAMLVKGRLPLLSSFVATREGVMMLYPGRGSYPKHYDPRQRPWFRVAAKKKGLHWSKPYVSSQKIRAVLMACTTSVFSQKGDFLAVAGIDLRVNRLAYFLRVMKRQTPWVQDIYLVQEDGNIVVQTNRLFRPVKGRQIINQSLKMTPIPIPGLVLRMKQQQKQGYFLMKTQKGQHLVVFVRLRAQPWYYVVVAK